MPPAWYESLFVIVPSLFFCFPLGLIFVWCKRSWTIATKAAVTLCYFALMFSGLALARREPAFIEAQRMATTPIATVTPVAVSIATPTPTPTPDPAHTRDVLRRVYQESISDFFPDYNFIQVKIGRHGKGYTLMAYHDYFSQYTFSVGGAASKVQAWIARHSDELKESGIVRVGVKGDDSSTWFNVE